MHSVLFKTLFLASDGSKGSSIDVSNIESGLSSAKNGTMSLVKFIVNDIADPIICAVLLGLLVFEITRCVSAHRQGEDYTRKIFVAIGIVVVLALVAAFPTWGWKLIGQ